MTIYKGRTRRNRIIIALAVAAAVVLFVLSRGCSFVGGPASGRVLDVDTGQPLPGAIVVARWNGAAMGLVHSSPVCFHVETTVSDADGRYHVAPWVQPPRPWAVWGTAKLLDAYLSGYESVRSQQTLSEAPNNVFMKKFTGTHAERFEYIDGRLFSGIACDNADASRRNLFGLQRAAIQEAKGLVQTENERRRVDGMRILAASDWLAAAPNYHETYLRPLENLPVNIRSELE